jgi:hypothetical protein
VALPINPGNSSWEFVSRLFALLGDAQAIRCDSLQLQGWPTRIEPYSPPSSVFYELLKPRTQDSPSSQESQAVCTKPVTSRTGKIVLIFERFPEMIGRVKSIAAELDELQLY